MGDTTITTGDTEPCPNCGNNVQSFRHAGRDYFVCGPTTGCEHRWDRIAHCPSMSTEADGWVVEYRPYRNASHWVVGNHLFRSETSAVSHADLTYPDSRIRPIRFGAPMFVREPDAIPVELSHDTECRQCGWQGLDSETNKQTDKTVAEMLDELFPEPAALPNRLNETLDELFVDELRLARTLEVLQAVLVRAGVIRPDAQPSACELLAAGENYAADAA